jgi:hypothetical protein
MGGGPAYGGRGGAVEVEGAGRSKAQLIVGIDFVSHPYDRICELFADSDVGHDLLWRCFCLCHQHRSQGRHHHRVAWRGQSNEAKGSRLAPRLLAPGGID